MVNKKFVIAKQLGGKRIVTNKGEELGRLSDILIDEKTGNLEAFLIEVGRESKISKDLAKHEGMSLVPYKSVFAVSDVIVVDETMLV